MSRISRRDFAKHAAILAGVAGVLPSALAENPPAANPPATPPVAPALPAASQAEVDARIAWVLNRYGSRLDETQRNDIRRLITGAQGGIDQMRAYPLDNSVGPATPFAIWRKDRSGTTAQRNLRPVTTTHDRKVKK